MNKRSDKKDKAVYSVYQRSNKVYRKKLYDPLDPLALGLDDNTLLTGDHKVLVREILRRLRCEPGVIVTDEIVIDRMIVMFAIATAIYLNDPEKRPVVVIVSGNSAEYETRSYQSFVKKYLKPAMRKQAPYATANTGKELIDLVNSSNRLKKAIIFSTRDSIAAALISRESDKNFSDLPLIIMDETAFQECQGEELWSGNVEFLNSRYFHRVFERMVVFTKPFSHFTDNELFYYLRRFHNIVWHERSEPAGMDETSYRKELDRLLANLEVAQGGCMRLNAAWQLLDPSRLLNGDATFRFAQIDAWLTSLKMTHSFEQMGLLAMGCYDQACRAMDNAKSILRHWLVQPSQYLTPLRTK